MRPTIAVMPSPLASSPSFLGRRRSTSDRSGAFPRKPGITGWAQINGWRGETDTVEKIQKRVEFDLYYIDNWSIWFDIQILLKTIFVILKDDKAY